MIYINHNNTSVLLFGYTKGPRHLHADFAIEANV